MTRLGRLLCTMYALTALWLAWCVVATFGRVPLPVSLLGAAASIVAVCAGVRESDHADELRAVRAELERAARPPLNQPAITAQERATFERIVAGIDLDDAA